MLRDHDPIVVSEFLGMFDRGDDDSVPLGFFKDSRNIRFTARGVKSREGTTLDISLSGVKRAAVYKRIGEAQRLLLLDGAGQLFDSTNLVTPILSIAAMTDFSVEVMFNRAYISPHNGVTGLPGEKVYVYEGSGLAREAGGTAPSGFTLTVADSATSGTCETGTHAFAVCFETSSGFLTKPGGFIQFSPAGGKKLDISNIPIGPAATAARVLLATKELIDFNGDFNDQEYFLIPNGRLAGNALTTLTVDFYDDSLVSSADYLLSQLSTIPAGVGLRNYGGRLCVWGEDANSAIVRASVSGQPESFDEIEGYVTINPGDSGGGVLNCRVYRKQFICFKDERSYITMDNGQNPAFWPVDSLDDSVGTSSHGIAQVRDYGDNLQDRLFVASRDGFHIFDGTFSGLPQSYVINEIWRRITDAYFHTIEAVIDPVEKLVYIAVPLDGATSPNYLLVGDFQEGFEKLKWTFWIFPKNTTTILVDVNSSTKASVFKFGASDGNVYKLNSAATDDFGTAINAYVQLGHLPMDDEGVVYHFTGIRLRVKGSGAFDISVQGEDAVQTLTVSSVTLSLLPGRELFRGFDFTNEKASVKVGVDGSGEKFTLTKLVLFLSPVWETRPE